MSAAEIAAWTRANLRARMAYYAGTAPKSDHPAHTCPSCQRSHTGASRKCGACRQRAYREKKVEQG